MKLRNVGTGGKRNPELILVLRQSIILSDSLADFRGGHADDGIGGRVVLYASSKHLYADGALFQLIGISLEGVLDHKSEKGRKAAAVIKRRTLNQPLELFANGRGRDGCLLLRIHVLVVQAHTGPAKA